MKRVLGIFVGVIFFGSFASMVNAQPGGFLMMQVGRWESQNLPLELVRNKEVASFLEINEKQIEQIETEVKHTHQRIDKIFKDQLRTHEKDELQAISKACRKEIGVFQQKLFENMENSQSKKLKQLCGRYLVQQRYQGVQGFLLSNEVSKMELTDDQIKAIRDVKDGAEKECLKFLNEKQLKYINDMLGEPVDFAKLKIEL